MGVYETMHEQLQVMGGGFASSFGPTHDVRRLSNTTNGSISNNAPIISGYRMWVDKASRSMVENQAFDTLIFEATCNNLALQKGDLLTQTGSPYNDGSIYTVAQMRASHPTLVVATPFGCSISRVIPSAGAADQQPLTPGAVATPGYAGAGKDTEVFLKLVNGGFEFSTDGTLPTASIQCGLQPVSRVRDAGNIGIPTALYREDYIAWIPLLGGEMIAEMDCIRFPSMDAYRIARLYSSGLVDFYGYLCTLERVNV